MYAALWRILPGPWWVRAVLTLLIVTAVLYGLFWWVFPWVSPLVSPGDVEIITTPGGAR